MWDWAWNVIDKASQVTGVLTVVPIIWTAMMVWHLDRRRRRELRRVAQTPGDRPAVLIVDVGTDSIRAIAERWVRQQEDFRDLPESAIHYLDHPGRLEIEQISGFMEKFRKAVGQIWKDGPDKIHLLYRGPIMLAAMIGAELSNGTTVILYQHESNFGYRNWGPLHQI